MGWLIAALGTGLAIGGTLAIYFGAPYIQVEWGYSEVIAGTTALSAGILAVALASILFALRDLKRLATLAGEGAKARSDGWPGSNGPSTRLVDAVDTTVPGASVATRTTIEPGRNGGEAPLRSEPALFRAAEETGPPAAAPADQAPTVVGRYEANGASYVLFSDGTIEVESEAGTHRYASMQDLRADIERQGTG